LQQLPADSDPRLRERLTAERDKASERHRQLAMLTSKINQWWTELRLPAGSELQLPPPSQSILRSGETAAEAVANVRMEIAGLKQQIAQVRAAPLKTVSQMEAIGSISTAWCNGPNRKSASTFAAMRGCCGSRI
jgi:hypothetical protein